MTTSLRERSGSRIHALSISLHGVYVFFSFLFTKRRASLNYKYFPRCLLREILSFYAKHSSFRLRDLHNFYAIRVNIYTRAHSSGQLSVNANVLRSSSLSELNVSELKSPRYLSRSIQNSCYVSHGTVRRICRSPVKLEERREIRRESSRLRCRNASSFSQ